jgi:hypothetical protein
VLALVSAPIATVPSAVEGACTAVPLYEGGRAAKSVCPEDLPPQVAVIDLSDDWAPRIFSETTTLPQAYRGVFSALANERLGSTRGWDTAFVDRYYELFGVPPSLTVVRGRLLDHARHRCHGEIAGLPSANSAAATPATVAWLQAHLRCDGLLPSQAVPGTLDGLTRRGLRLYQRRHMIPSPAQIDSETRTTLANDSRELDFRALLRSLRERVVDATGLIEDGSASNAWQTVLGRHLEAAEYRPTLRPTPVMPAAPDLIAGATEAVALALGWTSPEAATAAAGTPLPRRVAVRLPALPAYHTASMELRAEIDRGDVWREEPVDAEGRARRSPVRRRPTLVLYAQTEAGEIALLRWPTTIGGWQPESLPDGSLELRYKASPTGRRYWRDLLAGPAWFPPPTTPDRELVRRRADGSWTTDDDAVGPGYRSAYGLMALLHHRAVDATDGNVFIHRHPDPHPRVGQLPLHPARLEPWVPSPVQPPGHPPGLLPARPPAFRAPRIDRGPLPPSHQLAGPRARPARADPRLPLRARPSGPGRRLARQGGQKPLVPTAGRPRGPPDTTIEEPVTLTP